MTLAIGSVGRDGGPASEGASPRIRRSSLYARVVTVHAGILLAGLSLLLWTPVTVSASASVRQAIILVAAVMVLASVDAVMLKLSFTGLAALVDRMRTLDLLRPRERLPEMGGVETRALISGFNTMLDRLEAERRASTGRIVASLEEERQRISRELHDEIGQRLTAILLQLSPICDEAPDTTRSAITAVQDEVRAVLGEIGDLTWRIRPAILDGLGLLSALTALATSLGDEGPARIATLLPDRLPPMSNEAELAIYRITQEALTNAVRHSGASCIAVEIQVSRAELVLRVTDDGYAPVDANAEGPGLRGMRERALLVGGQLEISVNSPHGLRIDLTIPTECLGG